MDTKQISQAVEAALPARSTGTERIFLTIEDTAKVLNMGRSWVYERVLLGDLPSVKLGSARRIPATEVDAFAARIIAEQIGTVQAEPVPASH